MTALHNAVDPDGLLEYSVVYTDRALNHMSKRFQGVMRDISALLKEVYVAEAVAVIPGSGTYGMEAVVRQFAQGKHCMTLRNGFFNFRWSQIFAVSKIIGEETVLKARPIAAGDQAPFAPAPLDEVVKSIREKRPDLVFATHVETSAGIILPDEYIKQVAAAVHEVGGLLVLDCIASGALWVNMKTLGVDILTTAPQKGWTGSPCAGLVMLSERALQVMENTQSDSFAIDLKKWCDIMQSYEDGSHSYHATMPTDSLRVFRDVMLEAKRIGFAELTRRQWELGNKVRALLTDKGFPSLAAEGYEAPCVVVCYTDDSEIQSGKKFAENGIQIASGVPLKCDEPAAFSTFRMGLFGLDKLIHIDRTVDLLRTGLNKIEQGA
ncbi:MAG: aminotransferase class V-fold PLP-dependent enzyme [Neisseria sp.]|nr:aminotransferase class V-fold PLP-dependent enzyme [Neisseria sp.]